MPLRRLKAVLFRTTVRNGVSEGIGRRRDLRGLGERGSGGTIKGMLWGLLGFVVTRKLGSNNKDGMFTFYLMLVICWEYI